MSLKGILRGTVAALAFTALMPMTANAVAGGPTPSLGTVADATINIDNNACGGVMISPSWALTAKHCTNPAEALHPMTLGVRGEGATYGGEVHQHPTADLALVNIKGKHNGKVASLPSYHAGPGDSGKIVGFGGKNFLNPHAGSSDVIITETSTGVSSPYVGGSGSYHKYENRGGQTVLGDSGSPIFIGNEVHGIHANDLSVMVAVSDYTDWIANVSGVRGSTPAGSLTNTGHQPVGNWTPTALGAGTPASQVRDNGPTTKNPPRGGAASSSVF